MNRWWVESIEGGGRRRVNRYGNSRISKRMCVWRCYSVNECWTGTDISGERDVAATKQTIRRCSASIVLLTSIVHRVIESSSRHPSFSPLTRNSLWMDDDPIPKQSNSCLVGIWREQQELLVVYALHVSAWVTNGRSYFGRKSGLTRDAVQRLLLLDDKYLTSFFLKKKSAKIPRECNKILTRDKVGP